MKEVVLPSGNVLKIYDIPFDPANELKKEVLKAIQNVGVKIGREYLELSKECLCILLGSSTIELALWKCMERCILSVGITDLKIEKKIFENADLRADFTEIQIEVAKEALMPFTKGLIAALQNILTAVGADIQQ